MCEYPDMTHILLACDYLVTLGYIKDAIQLRLLQQEEASAKQRFWEQATGAAHLAELYRHKGDVAKADEWVEQTKGICGSLRRPQQTLELLFSEQGETSSSLR